MEITEVSYRRKKPKTKKVSRKTTKTALWAEFGLIRPPKPRYSGLRGVLWYVFSQYIRQRDKDLPCINCNLMKPDRHAGHFIPTGQCGWDGLVFHEYNVNSECSSCNMRDKRKLKYGLNLEVRHPGSRQEIESLYQAYKASEGAYKNLSRQEYREKIAYYQQKISTNLN